jgi:hypothetical protein
MNLAMHVAIFAVTNSGLWFFRILGERTSPLGTADSLPWTPLITLVWAGLLVAHAMFILTIANYSEPSTTATSAGTGFKPKATASTTKAPKQ